MARYRKSYSSFVKRTEKTNIADGSKILEMDVSALTTDNLPLDSLYTYNGANFKTITPITNAQTRRSAESDWLTSKDGDTFFTLDEVVEKGASFETQESTAKEDSLTPVLKMDSKNLLSYAYFGSCENLVRGAINNIVSTFPGSIVCIPRFKGKSYDILNPFGIDISKDYEETIEDEISIKNMIDSWHRYVIKECRYVTEVNDRGTERTYNRIDDCEYEIKSFKQNFRYLLGNGRIVTDEAEIENPVSKIEEGVKYIVNSPVQSGYVKYNGKIYANGDNFVGVKGISRIESNDGAAAYIDGYLKQIRSVVFEGAGKGDCNGYCEGEYSSGSYDVQFYIDGTPPSIRVYIDFAYLDDYDSCRIKSITSRIEKSCSNFKLEKDIHEVNLLEDNQYAPSQSFHIVPNNDYVEKWFASLDDFESCLLNRRTNPRYTATFNVVEEIDGDDVRYDKKFTWSTPDGWNLDVDGIGFNTYVTSLYDVAQKQDTVNSDNMYNMMTHESIKNMSDHSLVINDKENADDAYMEGETRIKAVIRLFGRMFDEVKKWAHGISVVNHITYDGEDNLPDFYLASRLSMEGWNYQSIVNQENKNMSTKNLYYGTSMGYNMNEIDNELKRRLIINGRQISRHKGTIEGVRMVMNLFGIENDKYDICTPNFITQSEMSKTDFDELSDIYDTLQYTRDEIIYNKDIINYDGNEDGFVDPIANMELEGICVKKQSNNNLRCCPLCSTPIVSGMLSEYKFEGKTMYEYEVFSASRKYGIRYNGKNYYNGDFFTYSAGAKNYDIIDVDGNIIPSEQYTDMDVDAYPSQRYGGGSGTIYSGVSVNNYTILCPLCGGSGYVGDYFGVPYFHGNTETLYYQQKGGWYRETCGYMRTVNDIDDLYFVPSSTLVNGDIYYVTNVEPGMVEVVNGEIQNNLEYVVTAMDDLSYVSYAGGIYKNNDTFYGVSGIDNFESKGSASVLFKPSHYYVVVDSTEPSLSENWENIPQRKFKSYTTKKNGIRVSVDKMNAIEDIKDLCNPHIGYGHYDMGLNYVQYFAKNKESVRLLDSSEREFYNKEFGLFKQTIDDCNCDYLKKSDDIIVSNMSIVANNRYKVHSEDGMGYVTYNGKKFLSEATFYGVEGMTEAIVEGDATISEIRYEKKQYADLFNKGFELIELCTPSIAVADAYGMLTDESGEKFRPRVFDDTYDDTYN